MQMFECREIEEFGLKWLCFEGRIDAMTSDEIEKTLNDLMLAGERVIGVDFEKVNYISSAGLRVFIRAQKQLSRVGGEVVLTAASPNVLDIFKMSGFGKLFRIEKTRKEVGSAVGASSETPEIISADIRGIDIGYVKREGVQGSLRVFGDQRKLDEAAYTESDVVKIDSKEIAFGVGLGTLGDRYEHYRDLFGEAMIINRNFFFYPGVKNPAVDFMLCKEEPSAIEYKFLHGFGFNGTFKYILSFEGKEGFIELTHLVNAFLRLSQADLLGLVILGESKGVWGMHLKRVPIPENRPENGKPIFDRGNFSDWLNFPLEPTDISHVVACTGIAVRDKERASPNLQNVMAEEGRFHVHGGIFSKSPLSKKIAQFEDELDRVLTELEVYKVQHLLGKTRFSSGMAGIVELKG